MLFKRTFEKLFQRIWRLRTFQSTEQHQQRLAYLDSQKFIYQNSGLKTRIFSNLQKYRAFCLNEANKDGLLFEFGVFKGNSINQFAKCLQGSGDNRLIYGFDSFIGFSEDWTGVEKSYPKEHFDLNGKLPKVEPNVKLINGFIEDTLETFLANNSVEKTAFIHIDTDTYSPAKTVLSLLKPTMQTGTVILFDELCGYPNWRSHEYRALEEVFDKDEYEFIGFSQKNSNSNLIKAAIQIL